MDESGETGEEEEPGMFDANEDRVDENAVEPEEKE